MGVLSSIGLVPNPRPGGQKYGGSSDPLKNIKRTVMLGDSVRGWIVEGLPLVVGIMYLYDKAFIEGTDRSWSAGDVLLSYLVAIVALRTSVVRRWL